ncbi:hypothetical protein BSL78_14107 [Apostichopus japonicus]|uniref:Integrase catalytic domain-containing protein n=1 Tax=Stichopus japonicus TaxID=307972 RepID=A0A2G8KLW3_STIJA|nr:hypothetical protein BSL78_14107 [Apostichopus japonicus]
MYQKLEKGGLGVVHLGSKLTFLLFKQFVAVTDPGLPCSYFVRFWGALHLRRWVPALFSNREPHSSTPNRVVRVICSALIELPPVDLSQPALVHSSLRDKALNAIFVQGRHSAEVWRSVHSRLNGCRLRDLTWRVAHGALVTNLKRYHWGFGDGLCPRTGFDSLESTAHVFWHCPFVLNLWEWFQSWTDRLTGDRSWSVVLRKMGIRHETSSPYSPLQNGTAERQWRTLFQMGRCLLIDKGLPKFLWTYAVQTAAHIRNRCFNNRIKHPLSHVNREPT